MGHLHFFPFSCPFRSSFFVLSAVVPFGVRFSFRSSSGRSLVCFLLSSFVWSTLRRSFYSSFFSLRLPIFGPEEISLTTLDSLLFTLVSPLVTSPPLAGFPERLFSAARKGSSSLVSSLTVVCLFGMCAPTLVLLLSVLSSADTFLTVKVRRDFYLFPVLLLLFDALPLFCIGTALLELCFAHPFTFFVKNSSSPVRRGCCWVFFPLFFCPTRSFAEVVSSPQGWTPVSAIYSSQMFLFPFPSCVKSLLTVFALPPPPTFRILMGRM